MELKDRLGGKGANLAEMTSALGLPVPPGFTITTDACRKYMNDGWPAGLDQELDRYLGRTQNAMVARSATPRTALVSVRSGASSMPGMMDTILNLGLNDRSVEGLAGPAAVSASRTPGRMAAVHVRQGRAGADPEPSRTRSRPPRSARV